MNLLNDLGYERVTCDVPSYIKYRKRDYRNIADIVLILNPSDKTISGGLITLKSMRDEDDIAYQYTVFREYKRDIEAISEKLGYLII